MPYRDSPVFDEGDSNPIQPDPLPPPTGGRVSEPITHPDLDRVINDLPIAYTNKGKLIAVGAIALVILLIVKG